jgi:hypothetical protein
MSVQTKGEKDQYSALRVWLCFVFSAWGLMVAEKCFHR